MRDNNKLDDNKLDDLIKDSLQEFADISTDHIDLDAKWTDFEQKIASQVEVKPPNQPRPSYIKKLLIASIAIILLLSVSVVPNHVNAFKIDIFSLFTKTEENTVIRESANEGEFNPNKHEGLTFEEAQAISVFHLKYPAYLPEGMELIEVSAEVDMHPHIAVTQVFTKGDKLIFLRQENIAEERQVNTYVPNNQDLEVVNIGNLDVTIITSQKNFRSQWMQDGIRFSMVTSNLERDQMIRVIEKIK